MRVLQRVPSDQRASRDYLLLHGACLARAHRAVEAVESFSALLASDPDCHEALTWMALLKKDPSDMTESLAYARRAVALKPDDAAGYGSLGSGYLTARMPELAIEALSKAVEFAPDVAEHRHNLALAYLTVHRSHEAMAELRRAIELAPMSPENYLLLASTYSQFGMAGQAIECLGLGLTRLPKSAALHTAVAGAFASVRNDEAAERHHRRAMELHRDSRGSFGAWLLNQGRFEESRAIFEQMIREGSDLAFAYYNLMLATRLSDSAEDTALVRRMYALAESDLRPRAEMHLRYALGRAEEQRKQFGVAMEHFNAANRLARRIFHGGQNVSSQRYADEHADSRRLFERLRGQGVQGTSTEAPIFIVGMIRSGTTLLDQIVSSHPAVASGGELRFWMEEGRRLAVRETVPSRQDLDGLTGDYVQYARLLAGAEERFTDKMPLNFGYLGLIHLAMPNARFLHIRRHPVDIALSIWTTFFGQGPLFAYDKSQIVGYFREYQRAMEFWRKALPADRLMELDYEHLIADPSAVVPQVIEFCGLPWDEACLRHEENRSAINTPSRWQARQPIYRTSVERWRRYEPWLGEFAELLS